MNPMKKSLVAIALVSTLTLSGCGYNTLQVKDEAVTASWSEVQNQYQRRADLVPNLVNVVKGYAKHEEQVLTEVTQARANVAGLKVDKEVFELTQRALEFSRITKGAFDISFAAMDRIWKFDGSMTEMPTAEAIKKSVEKVGYQNIILDSVQSTIFLKVNGMKIGFGALGEGYATDKCRAMMLAKGIPSGIINGSGDMSTWGTQPNGKPWNIGITNPFRPEKIMAVVPLRQEAVTTSGSYEKYVVFDGKRYSHIINPATGYPVTGLCSVTVFGPNAETANGLSTSLMVLGQQQGLLLLEKFPDYSCVMITDNGKVIRSKNFKKKLKTKL